MGAKSYVGWPSSPGNPGTSSYRYPGLATKDAVCAEECSIYGLTLRNSNAVPVYLNLYDAQSGTVVVGGGTANLKPIDRLMIPATGQLIISPGPYPIYHFENALTIAPVTGDSDASNAAPSTGIYVRILYAK